MSSYGYYGLDEEQWRLNDELRALGGGSVKSTRIGLNVIYQQGEKCNRKRSILTPLETSIGLRDVHMPIDTPQAMNTRFFPCMPQDIRCNVADMAVTDEAVRTVVEGFNKCLITFGEKGVGKTRFMFGDNDTADEPLSACVLQRLFAQLSLKADLKSYIIMMSIWIVRGNSVIDMLSTPPTTRAAADPSSFTLIHCPTAQIAIDLLKTSRNRSIGVKCSEIPPREEDRAHFFCRIVVLQCQHRDPHETGTLSSLLLVDLLGSAPTSGLAFTSLSESERIHRRITALHLQTLTQVLHQMSDTASKSEAPQLMTTHSKPQITSARDSALTAVLCPLLQGNMHTTFIAFIVDDEDHHAATKRTLISLSCVSKISCACFITGGVALTSLDAKSYRTVLSAPIGILHEDVNSKISSSINKSRPQLDEQWTQKLSGIMNDFKAVMKPKQKVKTYSKKDNTETVEDEAEELTLENSTDKNNNGIDVEEEKLSERFIASSNENSLVLANRAVIEENRQLKNRVEALREELTLMQESALEQRHERDIRMHNLEMELLRKRSLETQLNGDNSSAFRLFEVELERLSKENSNLRRNISRLTFKALDDEAGDGIRASQVSIRSTPNLSSFRAVQLLKRSDKEREELKRTVEELRKKERAYALAVASIDDLSKKLKQSHSRGTRLSIDYSASRESFSRLEKEHLALREDADILRESNGQLRVERARLIEELDLLRAVVRDAQWDRKRQDKMNKFAVKHAGGLASMPASLLATPSINGLSDAMYSRGEEKRGASPAVETAAAALHSSLAQKDPTLLPAFRTLMNEVYADFSRFAEDKAKFLHIMYRG